MDQRGRRISGWKAIASHFGRDRSTAIRWAQERGLPVHYVPGGGSKKTVFAFATELDAWAAGGGVTAAAEDGISPPPAAKPKRWPPAILASACAAALVAIALFFLLPFRQASTSPALPSNPRVAALYVKGRNHWAQREPASLALAIAELEAVTRADPGYAPALAALADAYLLAREFGAMSDAVAYGRARIAAERASRIDASLPAAQRAIGFIAYWWEHDRAQSARAFGAALRLDPADSQTHFWYGNILSDNGEHDAALNELNSARLADPGSVAIATDYAWALWAAGDDRTAITELEEILRRNPGFAVAHECLGIIRLAAGDYGQYLAELHARQRARSDPWLAERIAQLEAARAAGGIGALQRRMLDHALEDERAAAVPDHAWAAFVASLAGDRAQLLQILRLAEQGRQTWGSSGYTTRIAQRWKADREIITLLRGRLPPPMNAAV